MNHDSIQIGIREEWGQSVPFGISLPDLRQHIYIIGKTGSGKTTLLRNMIIQHIALGHGVGLIDPHGDLAEDLLDHIPRSRTDHLVYALSSRTTLRTVLPLGIARARLAGV